VLEMTGELVETEKEMQTFCKAVGELVLWGSRIDQQLTKAVIRTCSLKETPLLEPVVAELGVRAKIDILRARSKLIKPITWSKGISTWLNKADKVNGYRNIVAHHQVEQGANGQLILFSPQARRLLRNIKDLKPAPAKTIDDVHKWEEQAKDAHKRGQIVLVNLDRFAKEADRTPS